MKPFSYYASHILSAILPTTDSLVIPKKNFFVRLLPNSWQQAIIGCYSFEMFSRVLRLPSKHFPLDYKLRCYWQLFGFNVSTHKDLPQYLGAPVLEPFVQFDFLGYSLVIEKHDQLLPRKIWLTFPWQASICYSVIGFCRNKFYQTEFYISVNDESEASWIASGIIASYDPTASIESTWVYAIGDKFAPAFNDEIEF
jgi:hypothetical protein